MPIDSSSDSTDAGTLLRERSLYKSLTTLKVILKCSLHKSKLGRNTDLKIPVLKCSQLLQEERRPVC